MRVLEIGHGIAPAYAGKLLADLGADVVRLEHQDPLRSERELFQYLNTNKRSVLAAPEGWADVVIENVGAAHTAPVVVHITPYGLTGPYSGLPATELTIQAAAGLMAARGSPDREPVMAGGRVLEWTAGVYAVAAALTAVVTGEDGELDVSLFDCAVTVQPFGMLQRVADRFEEQPVARSMRGSRPGIVRCKDGWVGINALTGQQWADCCALLEVPEFEDRQMLNTTDGSEAFYAAIRTWLDAHTVDEVVGLGQLYRVPTAPLGNGRTLLEFAQFRERGFYRRHPWGEFMQPGFPYRFSTIPLSLRTPAPEPAVHDLVPRTAHARPQLDLRTIRILDLTTFWSGPAATMYLASLGADVIKVESVQRPDGFRPSAAPPRGTHPQWYEMSLIWQCANLDKRGITLDLGDREGMALFTRLLATADVLVENFAPRVVENFGLTYDVVRDVKPDIVYVRSPGFGLEGPWRDWVGWAMAFEQATGMAWVTGYPDDVPMTIGGACDGIVAMHTVVAILSALEHRSTTGEGQHIEVAQAEVAACLTAEQVIEWSARGRLVSREGNWPGGVYRCAGTNSWVASDSAGVPEGDAATVLADLRARGIACSDVVTGAQLHTDPHVIARGLLQEVEHPLGGTHEFFTWFGRPHRRPAPTLGQHNDEILGSELGLTRAQLDALRARNVIGERALHW